MPSALVDILRRYSNRRDLLNDLERAIARLARAAREPASERRSVRSAAGGRRNWAIHERLSETQLLELAQQFHSGTSKWKLAKLYGISESSVKRVLRLYRTGGWVARWAENQ